MIGTRLMLRSGFRRAAFSVLAGLLSCAPAAAGKRTDVVTLRNGDRITGEVKRLDRGQLEFKTDDAAPSTSSGTR